LIKNSSITKLAKGSPALGILASPSFNEINFEFTQSDILIAYSDGVTEARNETGEFFSEERLTMELSNISEMSTKQIGEKILAMVDRFVGKAKVHDDLTLAIIKRSK
ncbi:MAG: serine/threonine-protein phosphatase, partial [Ignavibacteriaceae bacterium]|nr:serine/threonine-protein phosphatase [Ignavibacteriaceae bacterium]